MSKIDFRQVKLDRLEEIKRQMTCHAINKNWREYYNLRDEKEALMKSLGITGRRRRKNEQ
ncbi:MAG: hypothetical protein ACRDA4_08045 [Filifactoraceae bacterium]